MQLGTSIDSISGFLSSTTGSSAGVSSCGTAVPQTLQNLAPALSVFPHTEQTLLFISFCGILVPQAAQNFAPSATGRPHFGQFSILIPSFHIIIDPLSPFG